MKKSHNSSIPQISSDHGRRDFLSLSLLAGSSTLLLSTERYGYAQANENNDVAIASEVSAADSVAMYTNLLDEVRRLVLRKDAETIFVAKMEATTWLEGVTSQADRLRSALPEGATVTAENKADLRNLLSEVVNGGREIRDALYQMRRQPLEEIKRLDTDFDNIRADLLTASNAIKNHKPGIAQEAIAAAMNKLEKYSTPGIEMASKALEQEYKTSLITPKRLQALLQTVRDSLDTRPSPGGADLNHAKAYFTRVSYSHSVIVAPALQRGITAVLRAKLNPSSWLQIGIGYAVTFPILLRVSNRDNRIKLLNDALRLVPPGLRNPLLSELASDLASL